MVVFENDEQQDSLVYNGEAKEEPSKRGGMLILPVRAFESAKRARNAHGKREGASLRASRLRFCETRESSPRSSARCFQ